VPSWPGVAAAAGAPCQRLDAQATRLYSDSRIRAGLSRPSRTAAAGVTTVTVTVTVGPGHLASHHDGPGPDVSLRVTQLSLTSGASESSAPLESVTGHPNHWQACVQSESVSDSLAESDSEH
jgi:hypothetical protein